LVAVLDGHGHAGDDGLLADIEMAETADEAHAVKLARLLLEAADQEHVAIGLELIILGELGRRRSLECGLGFGVRLLRSGGRLPGGCRHVALPVCVSSLNTGGLAPPA